jgi:GNAT superfamily N-acetyltransferase
MTATAGGDRLAPMDPVIRPLLDADRPAVSRLLDETVGVGFWRFTDGVGALSFVAVSGEDVAGVVLACLEPADDPDVRTALGGSAGSPAEVGQLVLHVRQLAVAPTARRTGLASRLLARAETEALANGARAAFAFGWLPFGRPEPDAVPFYEACGYQAGPDILDFYAQGSVATGAACPYCGDPPCRCAARPFVKALAPA